MLLIVLIVLRYTPLRSLCDGNIHFRIYDSAHLCNLMTYHFNSRGERNWVPTFLSLVVICGLHPLLAFRNLPGSVHFLSYELD